MKINGYKEYAPPLALKPFLVCYWAYSVSLSDITIHTHPIIPDGCVDIIFDLNCPSNFDNFVVGAMTKPITNSKNNLIGVRFKPGVAHTFLQIPVHEITDQIIEYNQFVGYSEDLPKILADTDSTNQQIYFLNQIFYQKLVGLSPVAPQISQAVNIIKQGDGKYTISQLSNKIGWTRQHLTRECLKYVGLSPKFLSQVMRVKKVIQAIKIMKSCNWCQLSIDCGYYDQSHMINEFKKITGLTPQKYLQI